MVHEYRPSRFGPACVLAVGLMFTFFAVVALLQDYLIPGIGLLAVSLPFNVWGARMLLRGGKLVFDDVGIDDVGRGFRLPWGSISDLELKSEEVNTVHVPGIAATGTIWWLVATLEEGALRPERAPRAGGREGLIRYSLQGFWEEPEEVLDAALTHWRVATGAAS